MWKCDFVFHADLLSDNDLAYIIELIPVFIKRVHVPIQRLELGPPGIAMFSAFAMKNAFLSNK